VEGRRQGSRAHSTAITSSRIQKERERSATVGHRLRSSRKDRVICGEGRRDEVDPRQTTNPAGGHSPLRDTTVDPHLGTASDHDEKDDREQGEQGDENEQEPQERKHALRQYPRCRRVTRRNHMFSGRRAPPAHLARSQSGSARGTQGAPHQHRRHRGVSGEMRREWLRVSRRMGTDRWSSYRFSHRRCWSRFASEPARSRRSGRSGTDRACATSASAHPDRGTSPESRRDLRSASSRRGT
jgi:hypothetical protein